MIFNKGITLLFYLSQRKAIVGSQYKASCSSFQIVRKDTCHICSWVPIRFYVQPHAIRRQGAMFLDIKVKTATYPAL